MSADDLAARLGAALRDLDGYIERRAAELAAPLVAAAEERAEERVRTAKLETQRQEDLVTELGRRLRACERQMARYREIADGKAADFIVRCDEVREGDRLTDDGDTLLATVRHVDVYDDHLGISVQRDDGRLSYLDRQPDSLTAVRREAS